MDPKCPRCSSDQTKRVTNYGRPVGNEWYCLGCRRRWDESNRPAEDNQNVIKKEIEFLNQVMAMAMSCNDIHDFRRILKKSIEERTNRSLPLTRAKLDSWT